MYLKQKESPWNRSWKFGIFRICFGFPIFLFLLLWTLCSVMRRPSNDAVAVWTAVSHVLLNRQRSVVIRIMIMIILSMVNGDQNYDHGHDWWGSWWYLGTSLKSTTFFSWPYWDIKISKWTHKTFPKIIWLCHFFVIFRFVRNIFLMTVAFDPL